MVNKIVGSVTNFKVVELNINKRLCRKRKKKSVKTQTSFKELINLLTFGVRQLVL